MPSIRNIRHKATATIKKNIYLHRIMSLLFRDVLDKHGRDNMLLWREVNKRKYLGLPKFEENIKKGEEALPNELVETLDKELNSNRKKTMFFKITDRQLGVRKLYDIDKQIERVK